MLKLKKIAITGGIASGKSTVCRAFQELGAYVVDADAIIHELLTPKTSIGQQIIRLLGSDILQDGKLVRHRIADKVFNNPETLHALEQILHPPLLRKIDELYEEACHHGSYKAFVAEIPLLFEIGEEDSYDAVIAVLSPEEKARKRYRAAGHSDEEFSLRMSRQLDPQEKARRADYLIHNGGSLDETRKQVIKISNEVCSS